LSYEDIQSNAHNMTLNSLHRNPALLGTLSLEPRSLSANCPHGVHAGCGRLISFIKNVEKTLML